MQMIESHSRCIRISDTGICRFCLSKDIIKNGTTKNRKQQYFCKNCRKRFIDFYTYKAYSEGINSLIIQFTKEGLGIRSTARILQISTTTLLKRVINISNNISQPAIPLHQSYELDEMRFYIGNKSNQMWLSYAINKNTKEVVSFNVGKRTNKTLNEIIKTLINSKTEKIFTDKLRNYRYLIPQEIHSVKRFGTNSIERKNLTIRAHLKRFNRKTICFSKSLTVLNAVLRIYFWGKVE